jgi:alpha-tubulin suppressor-like RCC1 family protein
VRPSSVKAKTVAAGFGFTCAVTPAGRVKCWGTNREGELGAGLPIDGRASLPVEVVGLEDVRTISASESFVCALTGGGATWCWGLNSGVISLVADAATSAVPVRVAGVDDGTSVSVGSSQSCIVRTAGKVSCWGAIHSGATVIDDRSVATSSPTEIAGLAGVVALGQGFTEPRFVSLVNACAVINDGTVRCWGAGYLGNGEDYLGAVEAPTTVRGLGDATLVASAFQATFVLRASGGVVGWGNNDRGRLGDGTRERRTTPTAVVGIDGAVDIAAGDEHACAVLANGHVRCWGDNSHGQLGNGTFSSTLVPVEIDGITNAVQVITGGQHTCALLADGQLLCWGNNESAQLGRGGANAYARPVLVRGL